MTEKKKFEFDFYKLGLFALALIIIFSIIAIIVFKIDLVKLLFSLKEFGLVGLFVAAFVANASLFLVTPLDLIIFTFGVVYPPLMVAIAAGLGAAIGEMSGYIVGLGGRETIAKVKLEHLRHLDEVYAKIKLFGFPFIVFGAFIPFPFDLIGITCGLFRYTWYKFFAAALIGKFFRYLLVSYAGLYGVQLIKTIFLIG